MELRQWVLQALDHDSDRGVGTMDYITCEICTILWPFLKLYDQLPLPIDLAINLIVWICQIAELAPKPEICRPTIEGYAVRFHFIFTLLYLI